MRVQSPRINRIEEVLTDAGPAEDDVVLTIPDGVESCVDISDGEAEFLVEGLAALLKEEIDEPADGEVEVADDDDEIQRRNDRSVSLYHAARADGFKGRRWNELVIVLAEYGLGWLEWSLITGKVYGDLRAMNRGVSATDVEKALLRTDPVLRQDLADAVVTAGLKQFRNAGLKGDG